MNLVLVGGRLLEPGPGALQHAVHGGGRGAKQFRDLRCPPAQHVAQDQHGALPGRQVLQGGDQGQPHALPRRDDLGRIAGPGADQRVRNGLQPRKLRPRRGQRGFRVLARGAQAGRQGPAAAGFQRAQARRWWRSGTARVQEATPALEITVGPPGPDHIVSCTWSFGIVDRAQHPVTVRQQLRPERVGETREILADCHGCFLRPPRAGLSGAGLSGAGPSRAGPPH